MILIIYSYYSILSLFSLKSDVITMGLMVFVWSENCAPDALCLSQKMQLTRVPPDSKTARIQQFSENRRALKNEPFPEPFMPCTCATSFCWL